MFLADAGCLPQTLAVLATRAEPLGISLVTGPVTPELIAAQPAGELFGVLLQYPAASGAVTDPRPVIEAAHAAGAQVAMAADLLALTLLTPPGELGADIAVGTTQRFGVPMGYGGPHAGYICVRDALKRQLPGRLVGVSLDADGQPAYRLALQAREQHIRREKATSNICTAQVLLAVIAAMYAVYHGPEGLTAIAHRVRARATALSRALHALGYETDRCPVLRHRPGDHARRGGERGAAGPPPPGTTCTWTAPTHSRSRATRPPPRTISGPSWPRWPAGRSRCPPRRPRSPSPRAWPGRARSSPTRCSARTAARRPCSATCGGWPTWTSRWTGR